MDRPALIQQVSAEFPSPSPFGAGPALGHTPAAPEPAQPAELTRGGHSRVTPALANPADDNSAPAIEDPFAAGAAPRLISGPDLQRSAPPAGVPPLPFNMPLPAPVEPLPPTLVNPPGLGPAPGPGMPVGPGPGVSDFLQAYGPNTHVVRIPIRLSPGEMATFNEADVILNDGDIVFIESRETEIFYTGGLLGGGQYTLPRDYDLDVLGAISIASGRQQAGGSGQGIGNRVGGISAMNQDISVSASDVVILRQLPDGSQIPIKVDLSRALREPRERVLIQPGDYIILQYKPLEAVAAFVERNLLAGSLFGLAAAQVRSGN
jgi:hypothetical protein